MPDLTLDEFKEVSKEDLKEILHKESIRRGTREDPSCDVDIEKSLTDSSSEWNHRG